MAEQAGQVGATTAGMGYQPGLDGLRAISVVAVICYHAGFGWAAGGFFGVEVFFVISGYLITVLLIEERERAGRISLTSFWIRRARRLLPALAAMLLLVATWVAWLGTREQAAQLRHDLPWALGYIANWGQIESGQPYFAAGSPPMLRHLWSLGVEEQWYLLWPLAFVLLGSRMSAVGARRILLVAVASVAAASWWIRRGRWPFESAHWSSDELVNIAYLSTPTRCGGLLLGAALAFAWRPWRHDTGVNDRSIVASLRLDVTAVVAIGVLACCFVAVHLTASAVYPWFLLLVSSMSTVAIAVVVHPAAQVSRRLLGWGPLAALGRRSYGLYLWHWPVFVIVGATTGSVLRSAVGIALAAVLTEVSYRFVEAPFRRRDLLRSARRRLAPAAAASLLAGAMAVHYSTGVAPFDVAAGGDQATFQLRTPPVTVVARTSTTLGSTTPGTVAPPSGSAAPTTTALTAAPSTAPASAAPTTTVPRPPIPLPVRLGLVGDSQAHSLAINLPRGIEQYFDVGDGSLDGCGVIDVGNVRSARSGFQSELERCMGWQDQWASTAAESDIVLVVIGAWEVFDLEIDGELVPFGSARHDRMLADALAHGLNTIVEQGALAALLEVPCMRPVENKGARVPALPERGDDVRTAHLNELTKAAIEDIAGAFFVSGPDWCGNEAVATDLDYRWDGVHVYRPGADYVYEAIAPALLELAGHGTS